MDVKLCCLNGQWVQLEPIALVHKKALAQAADDVRIWQYMPFMAMREHFTQWFDEALTKTIARQQLTYVIRERKNQLLAGATAYGDFSWEHKRLTLAYSWLHPRFWGTKMNTEAKLLMLSQAFDTWQINRIEIGTDSENKRSHAAILKLGATEEGYLRQHMRNHDGRLTDTVLFSIIASEWLPIKERLIKYCY
ncbi:MAG: GNAT family N-acetyltransferase [Legionella sp. 40-6]|nr:GNAT family N-acetyltransferase [Legionella sp.]OJY29403.1 MAG: GNAT family N-acetyltransferase [Legionella sp. 40-6]